VILLSEQTTILQQTCT